MKKSDKQKKLEEFLTDETSIQENSENLDNLDYSLLENADFGVKDLVNSESQSDLNEAENNEISSDIYNIEHEQDLHEQKVDDLNVQNNNSLDEKLVNDEIVKKSKKQKKEPKTFRKNLYSCFFKRFFDIILSGLALIILSPVMLVVAILIRIKLGKKVIFVQWRLSKGNKPFKLYKFRTMKNAYSKDGDLLPDSERITKFGTALRKTSLDELPQLWNIFKGDMSIIGPRPRMIQECVFLDEEMLNTRSYVRPGLTGLAQVNGRNNITFDQVVEYDKKYVKTINFWLDFKIFFKTIGKIFKSEDVNKNGTVSNEFYGDMLLRQGLITKEEYDEKQNMAKEIIKKVS